jgi:hypothetical protein
MSSCTTDIKTITETEYIGESLPTINNNFLLLKESACNLENRINNIVGARTFFYYGPNSATNPYSGMDNGVASVPSVATIQSFVNSVTGLNLPVATQQNDIAYVVYQKTGWFQPQTKIYVRSDQGNITFTTQEYYTYTVKVKIGIGRYRTETRTGLRDINRNVPWKITETVGDDNMLFSPQFVLYKLTYSGTGYVPNPGFPKFIQSITNSTVDWKNPNFWSTY